MLLAAAALSWPFTEPRTATAGFCLPSTGPASATFFSHRDKLSPTFNSSSRVTQLFRVDRTLEVQRIDVYQTLTSSQDGQFSLLTNYKQDASWEWFEDKSGKITCNKRPSGPQPTGSDCIARDPAAVRRGTQGPLEVTFFEGNLGGEPYNTTYVAAGGAPLIDNLLHYGSFFAPNASYGSEYFHMEVYDYSTDPIAESVFSAPPECPA